IFGVSHKTFAQNEVTLLAPRPVQGPIEKLNKEFEAKTNYKVNATWDSGLGTKKMVAEGKYQDVSVMFSPFPDALASGNVDKNSGQVLMRLVMAVAVKKGAPKPDISNAEAVKKMMLSAKSVGTDD